MLHSLHICPFELPSIELLQFGGPIQKVHDIAIVMMCISCVYMISVVDPKYGKQGIAHEILKALQN